MISPIKPITARDAAKLTVFELVELDLEFARRATLLGRPGVVGKSHKNVRNALAKKLT